MKPLTVEWVRSYAARRGQLADVGEPGNAPWREMSIRASGHQPKLHIACIDGDGKPQVAITYQPAAAVPQAG